MKRFSLSVGSLLVCMVAANAGQLNKLIPIHLAPYAPNLTGSLTNPAWREASVFTDFHTVLPQLGKKPSGRTSVYLMYDNDNIYVGLRMDDKEPSLIKATAKTEKEVEKDDWVALCLDPSPDHQNAVYFQVSASGVQANGKFAPNGARTQTDPVAWKSVVRKGPGGWTAEMAIPFTSLALQGKWELEAGFKVARSIARTGEQDDGPGSYPSSGPEIAQYQRIKFVAQKAGGEAGR
jgi:hypothetical protein